MKFIHAENIVGRGNVLVVDLEGKDIHCGDNLTFRVVGVERIEPSNKNTGLILVQEETK